jgi:hypothetical protein
MIILKAFFHEDSLAVLNFYVYDHLVPILNCGQQPSLEVFEQVTAFMSAAVDLFKQGQIVPGEQISDLLDAHLPELLPHMHNATVTHVTPEVLLSDVQLYKSPYHSDPTYYRKIFEWHDFISCDDFLMGSFSGQKKCGYM